MKNIVRLLQVATLAIVVMGVSKPAAAQVESYRFGYQFLHESCDGCDGTNIPLGFFGDVSGKLGPSLPMLNWVGQVAFGHKSESETVAGVTGDVSNNLTTFGGGVRYLFPLMSSDIKAHAQGLILIAHNSVSTSVSVPGFSQSFDASETKAGVEISAAVDYPMSNGWSVTGAAGFQRIFTEGEATNALLVRAGVVKKIGK